MKYGSFQIENFKGIESLKIDLQRQPHTPVTTLVGLNESGKTDVTPAPWTIFQLSQDPRSHAQTPPRLPAGVPRADR